MFTKSRVVLNLISTTTRNPKLLPAPAPFTPINGIKITLNNPFNNIPTTVVSITNLVFFAAMYVVPKKPERLENNIAKSKNGVNFHAS